MRTLILFSFLFVGSCMDSNLPDYHKLNTLRVLAIIADNPELNAGGSATISFLVSDTRGDGRALEFDSEVCLDPGTQYGAEPTCEGNPTKITLASNQSVSGLSAPDYTGIITETVTVAPNGVNGPAAAVVFAGRSSEDQFNGIALLVTFNLSSSDGEEVRSFKRVFISTRSTLNNNPAFSADAILRESDNTVLSAQPSRKTDLYAEYTTAGEDYDERDSSGNTTTRTETILTSWFVSDGKMSPGRTVETNASEYDPEDATGGRNNLVIAIARDGRGGIAYAIKSL